MAVKIRLARHGAKKRPYYRIVVADERMPRDGRFIEQVGRYNPITDPHVIELNLERVDYWLGEGAKPTSQVGHLIDIARKDPEQHSMKKVTEAESDSKGNELNR